MFDAYRQGCVAMIPRRPVVGAKSILDLPEPLPTLLLWALITVGAVIWVKSGGGLGII